MIWYLAQDNLQQPPAGQKLRTGVILLISYCSTIRTACICQAASDGLDMARHHCTISILRLLSSPSLSCTSGCSRYVTAGTFSNECNSVGYFARSDWSDICNRIGFHWKIGMQCFLIASALVRYWTRQHFRIHLVVLSVKPVIVRVNRPSMW